MDVKTQVVLLRAYSEQLSQLFTELNDTVNMLDHLLKSQAGNTAKKTEAGTERMATGQFLVETEVFCQRVTRFLVTSFPHAAKFLDPQETA